MRTRYIIVFMRFTTIFQTIKQAIGAIKNFIANNDTIGKEIVRDLAENQQKLEEYEKLWVSAFKAATRNYKAESTEVQSIAKENDGAESNGEVKYSIKKDKYGNEYWQIESNKDIFKGLTTPEEYRDAAYSFLINNRDNKVVVKDKYGNSIVFIRLSAEEFTHSNESTELYDNNPKIFNKKMRLIPSLEDILINSNVDWDSPDHKNHKLFKNGFKNYRGKVRIDNVIFNSIIRVGKAKFGNVFYDINLEVDSYLPHTKGASDINESTSTNDTIPQPHSKVNPQKEKFSLKEPVEQVGSLVAVHNFDEAKLKGNFELGGLPVPSIYHIKLSNSRDICKKAQQSLDDSMRKYFKRSRSLLIKAFNSFNDADKQAVNIMLSYSADIMDAHCLKNYFSLICKAVPNRLKKGCRSGYILPR